MLFMGEEWGEKAPFLYFTSHTDEELVKNVREGRKKEFSYFNFSGEFPDPQSEETFQKSTLRWNTDEPQHAAMLAFYKQSHSFAQNAQTLAGKGTQQPACVSGYRKQCAGDGTQKQHRLTAANL